MLLIHYRNIDGFKRVFAKEPNYLLTKSELENFLQDSQSALEILEKDSFVVRFLQSVKEKEAKKQEVQKE